MGFDEVHRVRVGELPVAYREAGEGEPLLLVHGWPLCGGRQTARQLSLRDPPVARAATERLSRMEDGRLLYRLKHRPLEPAHLPLLKWIRGVLRSHVLDALVLLARDPESIHPLGRSESLDQCSDPRGVRALPVHASASWTLREGLVELQCPRWDAPLHVGSRDTVQGAIALVAPRENADR